MAAGRGATTLQYRARATTGLIPPAPTPVRLDHAAERPQAPRCPASDALMPGRAAVLDDSHRGLRHLRLRIGRIPPWVRPPGSRADASPRRAYHVTPGDAFRTIHRPGARAKGYRHPRPVTSVHRPGCPPPARRADETDRL